jgi:hypothetical protein
MQDGSSQSRVESRAAARTNLFLAATLISSGAGHPVKIRDLSAIGARIETSLALEVGAAVVLVRGGLRVESRVGWHAARFCGLSFAAPLSIEDWMANPVNLDRQATPPVAVGGGVAAQVDREEPHAESIAEELTRVSRWLEAFGHTLANDPQVVFKHGTQLFSLGLAARSLAALAEAIQAENYSASSASRAKLASQCSPI